MTENIKEKEKSEKAGKAILEKIHSGAKWLGTHPVRMLMLLSVLLCFVVEILSRKSFWNASVFMLTNTIVFAYDSLIVFTTLALSFLFKKRKFFIVLGSIFWFAMGVTNFIILGFRVTPFEASDFSMLKSALSITSIYMKWWQVTLVILMLLAAILVLVLVFIKTRKVNVEWKKTAITIVSSICILIAATVSGRACGILETKFANPTEANKENGFAYCFSCSLFDRGISKPKNYSSEVMTEIASDLESGTGTKSTDVTPNIVFLQLESFYDLKNMNDLTFSENPNPNFDELCDKYPSGYLTVPSVGAGTANTEFEVISGMSLAYFGTGEYPYKTILQKSSCESICYNLRDYGYTSHAIHNNSGTFYDRNKIFSSLGFNSYTSLEYMQNIQMNELGWAKDSMLTEQILNSLKSTDNQDLVYTISVQAHGKYPSQYALSDGEISVGGIEDEQKLANFNYYVNQVRDVDKFIGELTQALSEFDEPTILVLYGDHLPTLDISQEELNNSSLFQVEYVIWNNYGLGGEDCDLYSYQLNAHVMGMLGMDTGILTKLHQNESREVDYQQQLELLEYDMLYGDKIVYGGVDFHEQTELRMGTYDISVTDISQNENGVYIKGKNFTEWSVAVFDGDNMDTKYLDGETLLIEGENLKPGMEIHISQMGTDREVLSSSKSYMIS